MDPNRVTEKVQEALQAAQSHAIRRSHQQVDVEQLLAALLEQEGGLAASILSKAGIPAGAAREQIKRELSRAPRVTGPTGAPPDGIYVTGRLNRLLTQAEEEAGKRKDKFVSGEHLLPAVTDDPGASGRILSRMGVTRGKLMQALRAIHKHKGKVTAFVPHDAMSGGTLIALAPTRSS